MPGPVQRIKKKIEQSRCDEIEFMPASERPIETYGSSHEIYFETPTFVWITVGAGIKYVWQHPEWYQ